MHEGILQANISQLPVDKSCSLGLAQPMRQCWWWCVLLLLLPLLLCAPCACSYRFVSYVMHPYTKTSLHTHNIATNERTNEQSFIRFEYDPVWQQWMCLFAPVSLYIVRCAHIFAAAAAVAVVVAVAVALAPAVAARSLARSLVRCFFRSIFHRTVFYIIKPSDISIYTLNAWIFPLLLKLNLFLLLRKYLKLLSRFI